MYTATVEKFADVYVEMKSLNLKHYDEISEHKKHGFELNPDYPAYFLKEEKGELLYIALRDTGKLVGYYIGFIGHSPHYQDCLQLNMDIIYVSPESRGHKGGIMLVEAVEAEARRRGIKVSIMGCKEAHKIYMDRLLRECGYSPFEANYSLWL